MSQRHIILESFDSASPTKPVESPDYTRGVADGLEMAQETQAEVAAKALAEIAATLNDMSFGYQEARHHIMVAIRPILAQLSEAILPQVLRDTFGAHLLEVVEAQVDSSIATPVQISVAPDAVDMLTDATPNVHFAFTGDPKLVGGQALIRQAETSVFLDLPALQTALQTAVNGLNEPERIHTNG